MRRRTAPTRGLAAATLTLLCAGLVGCGGIDTGELEDEISADAQEQVDAAEIDATVSSISCPDDIDSETGTEFECRLEFSDGTAAIASGEVTNGDEGEVEYQFTPVESE